MKLKILGLCAAGLLAGVATSTGAAERTYSLSNVVFSDGGVATGSFTFDTDLLPSAGFSSQLTITDWRINVAGGLVATFPPFEYNTQNTVATVIRRTSGELIFVWSDWPDSNRSFRLAPEALVFDGTSTVSLNWTLFGGLANQECFDCFPQRIMISGVLSPVTVTPETLLEALAFAVTGVGPGTSLFDQIALAQAYFAVPDLQATCETLTGFRNAVRAQRGKKLTQEFADELTADAQDVMTVLGCN